MWYLDDEKEEQEIEVYWESGKEEARGKELEELYSYQLGYEAVVAYKNLFYPDD